LGEGLDEVIDVRAMSWWYPLWYYELEVKVRSIYRVERCSPRYMVDINKKAVVKCLGAIRFGSRGQRLKYIVTERARPERMG
jgi:hypothetical protein